MAPPSKTSIMLVTGEYFDPFAPSAGVINLDVLAAGMRNPRFKAQTPRLISIGEHSMRVRRIARELAAFDPVQVEQQARSTYEDGRRAVINNWEHLAEGVRESWRQLVREHGSASTEILALVHDAHEPLSPWVDMPSPWKDDRIRGLEKQLDEVVKAAIGLPDFSYRDREIVKTADVIALYFEAMLWQPGSADWATNLVDWRLLAGDDAQIEFERFLPLIAPRPRECWRTEVEALLGGAGDV